VLLLQHAAHQEIEFLVGAAEFHIALHRHRVVTLHQRVHEFVDRDRLVGLETLAKVVALQHARDCHRSSELEHAGSAQLVEPGRIKHDLGLGRIENLEYLIGVGLGVELDLLFGQRRARGVLAGRIANARGEVANQKLRVMTEILQLTQLVDDHGVTEMQIRRGRIHAELDFQRLATLAALFQFLDQFGFRNDFFGAALDDFERSQRVRMNFDLVSHFGNK